MCWRERFLTLRSSLITYAGKGFVYVIIFSLTASPKAVTVQALPAAPAARGRVLSPPRDPAPNAAAPASPCANSPCRKSSSTLRCKPPARALQLTHGAQAAPRHSAPGGTRPASAARVNRGGTQPWCGPAVRPSVRPSCPAVSHAAAHPASGLQGSFSNAEGKGLIQGETPRKRRPFLL